MADSDINFDMKMVQEMTVDMALFLHYPIFISSICYVDFFSVSIDVIL